MCRPSKSIVGADAGIIIIFFENPAAAAADDDVVVLYCCCSSWAAAAAAAARRRKKKSGSWREDLVRNIQNSGPFSLNSRKSAGVSGIMKISNFR